MSNVRYIKTSKKEDKEVLTFEDELADEHDRIENGVTDEVIGDKEHIRRDNPSNSSSQENGERISDEEFDDEDGAHYPSAPPKSTVSACYMWWAIVSTTLLIALISIAIFAHPRKRNINWCCIDDEEMSRCEVMSVYFYADGLRPRIVCKPAGSIDECIHMIDHDAADVINLSSDDLFKYRKKVMPIMAADYDHESYGFYSVAVVHKDSPIKNLTSNSLSSSLACIADMNSVGKMIYQAGHDPTAETSCITNTNVALMFGKVCSPAMQSNGRFCSGCTSKCATPCKQNDYCGYSGALKCLLDATEKSNMNAIAFTNNIDAKKAFDTNDNHNTSDYRLLCPGGSRHVIDGFKSCNLGKIPSYSLAISNKGRADDDTDIPFDIMELLYVAQLYFGQHELGFHMYNTNTSTDGFRDAIFQKKTTKLVPLWFWMDCTSEAYLGEEYVRFKSALSCTKPSVSNATCHIPTGTQT